METAQPAVVEGSSSTTPQPSPQPSTSTAALPSSAPPTNMSAAFESPIQPAAPANHSTSPPLNPNLPVCANCRTQTTPLWRRSENGTLCNACSLYQKMKGTPRPVSLKTDVIKHRNRSKGENARKASKAAMAAAAAAQTASHFGDEHSRSHSRGQSTSRSRDGLGQKSGPGGADGEMDAEYWDDEGGDYKRARHGFMGYVHSPTRQPRGSSRGRGSRSSSQQRRSDSSESRSEGHTGNMGPPHLIPYPIFYYPPQAGGAQQMPPYPYGYPPPPPPPEWAAYMQQMQAQGMTPAIPPYMAPYAGYQPNATQTNGSAQDGNTLAPMRVQPGSRSQSVDSFAREAERGRTGMVMPPMHAPPSMPGPSSNGTANDVARAPAASAIPPQFYHPYMRSGPMHPRTTAAVSDARLTPPRDARPRRMSEGQRPTSSASSSGGSQEGRFDLSKSPALSASASRPPDAMTIDEVDEAPHTDGIAEPNATTPAHGPVRGGPSHERRGRSSTRKPAAGMPLDVDERLEKMRMESPRLNPTAMQPISSVLPPSTLPPTAPAGSTQAAGDEPVDELTALRLRVSELEFINGILQTRIGDLEKGIKQA